MKVLHVIPSVSPLRGGPSFAVAGLCRSLAAKGIEVHRASTDDNGPDRLDVAHERPLLEEGVVCWYFPRQTKFYSVSLPLGRWLNRNVAAYDLIHIHALFSFSTIAAWRAARRWCVPYVVTPHGSLGKWGRRYRRPAMKRLSLALLERPLLTGAAAIHFASSTESMEAKEVGVQARTVVIPFGVDLVVEAFNRPKDSAEARAGRSLSTGRVLYLSRIDRKKGLDLMVRAFAQLRNRGLQATLVVAGQGDPALLAELKSMASQLGVGQSVEWVGFVEGQEKLSLFGSADVFVLPSYSENFGLAAVEAMASGLPVVITDQVGISREVEQARAGLVVPCRAEALAGALERLLGDSNLRKRMGEAGRRLCQDSFSRESMASRFIKVYAQCLVASQSGGLA